MENIKGIGYILNDSSHVQQHFKIGCTMKHQPQQTIYNIKMSLQTPLNYAFKSLD